ncbi:unnamed protein product [Parnassius apollo]|uniref:(apollo) hypothetical protein n=1 Tax=Parnassius apollo TaxID=110799 RepID=A0A8S3XT34_PARAO|nr:unnamed protein product [Parnassius apollo]
MHKRRRKAALKAREFHDSLDLTFKQDDDDEWNNSTISSLKKTKAGKSKSETATCNKEKEVLTENDNSSSKKYKAGQSKIETVTCNKEKEVLTENDISLSKKCKAGQSETITCNKEKEIVNVLNRVKDSLDEETLSGSSIPEDFNKNGIVEMNSILLSDNDDDLIIEPKEPETSKKVKNIIEKQNEDDDNEQILLHPSLLTNNNYIKIVAHTYLTGNPMLDEDAAVLAAQYSTHKALKEIEMTGKDLCSGPIYDIAVKVVGKDI